MINIDVKIDDAQVKHLLESILRRTQDLTPAMQSIGEHLAESTKRRFETSTGPDGQRWAANRPATYARYLEKFDHTLTKKGKLNKHGSGLAMGKKPLVGESKNLATTIYSRPERRSVAIGSPMEYAATQQFGARRGAFGSTRRGVPIPWGDIPARPYLGISTDDWSVIRKTLYDFLLTL